MGDIEFVQCVGKYDSGESELSGVFEYPAIVNELKDLLNLLIADLVNAALSSDRGGKCIEMLLVMVAKGLRHGGEVLLPPVLTITSIVDTHGLLEGEEATRGFLRLGMKQSLNTIFSGGSVTVAFPKSFR